MRKTLFLLALFTVLLAAGSCKKCITCRTYAITDHSLVDETEECALPRVADDWEIDYKVDYQSNYTYIECTE
jgi:hypothetical protein